MTNAQFFELDPDDLHEVDLAGACSIDGTPVDAETGICQDGHDDLDRADHAAGYVGATDAEQRAIDGRLRRASRRQLTVARVAAVTAANAEDAIAEGLADEARGAALAGAPDPEATALDAVLADLCAYAASLCGPGEAAMVLVTRSEGPSYCVCSPEGAASTAASVAAGDDPELAGDVTAVLTVDAGGHLTSYPVVAR
jgi:hypothetical protein